MALLNGCKANAINRKRFFPPSTKQIFLYNCQALTFIPKCSVTPRPCSPSTPKERLSSKNILTLYLYFNFTYKFIQF